MSKTEENEERRSDNGMFELAIRKKLRWQSIRGPMSIEELWDLPLTSKDNFNLDFIGLAADEAQKVTGRSLVKKEKSPEEALASLRFDIVKYIIDTKIEEEAKAAKRASNRKEREKLKEILEQKQGEKLLGLSEVELQKRIAALSE